MDSAKQAFSSQYTECSAPSSSEKGTRSKTAKNGQNVKEY